MKAVVILAGIAIPILFILISELKIKFLVLKDAEREEIAIDFKGLYGLLKSHFEIPFVRLLKGDHLKDPIHVKTMMNVEGQDLVREEEEKKFTLESFHEMYKKSKDFYRAYSKSIHYLMDHVKLDKFQWETELGLEDAAVTAISTGFCWMIKGSVFTFISRRCPPEEICINVSPYYGGFKFETSFNCIITIKLGHIIIAALKILWQKVKRMVKK